MRIIALMLLIPGITVAEEFVPMTGEQIEAALNDTTLRYEEGQRQVFYASGKTLYDNGRPSWGNWQVRGDQYCSEWPPADGWACYDMDTDGTTLRFIGESGFITPGVREE